jgi:FkbM family methyltransferase
MIEQNGVLVHLDLLEDRIGDRPFAFEGWVAADRAATSVRLVGGSAPQLPLRERPDVKRAFPSRTATGFSGTAQRENFTEAGLRLGIQLGDETLEVVHPLAAALPRPALFAQFRSAVLAGWSRLRERWTRTPEQRWRLALRRHLRQRDARSGVFARRHTDALLGEFAGIFREADFLQIGANDGFTGDPLYPFLSQPGTHWRGVLVEPVEHLFTELAERHGRNPALRLERAIIGETDGATVIYRLQTDSADPLWLDQLPSVDLDVLQANARQFGAAEKQAIAETVACLSVETLLRRHQVKRLDLLLIDTEGWDWRILRQFDLATLRPKLILYEHQHLSAEARADAHRFLSGHGYDWAETAEGDTLAWRTR